MSEDLTYRLYEKMVEADFESQHHFYDLLLLCDPLEILDAAFFLYRKNGKERVLSLAVSLLQEQVKNE